MAGALRLAPKRRLGAVRHLPGGSLRGLPLWATLSGWFDLVRTTVVVHMDEIRTTHWQESAVFVHMDDISGSS